MARTYLFILLFLAGFAQGADAKNFDFTFSPKQTIGPGSTFYSGESRTPKWRIFVTEIDLKNPHIELVPATPPPDKGVRCAPSVMAGTMRAMVVVNNSFFAMNNGNPYGYFRTGGKTVRTNSSTPFGTMGVTWGASPKVHIGNIDAQEKSANVANPWPLKSIASAVAGGPVLMVDGQVQISKEYAELAKRNPRTVAGMNRKTQRLFLVVIDGRSSDSVGMTFDESARLMQDLGCTDAVNYDGGGSSAMVVNGKVMNKPSDGSQRSVPLGWAVLNSTVVDNAMAAPRFATTGEWAATAASANVSFYGNEAVSATGATRTATATYETALPQAGMYEVYARWDGAADRLANAVHYTVSYGAGSGTVVKDQTTGRGEWQLLGTYRFSAYVKAKVAVSNKGIPTDKTVCADAVRFVYVNSE